MTTTDHTTTTTTTNGDTKNNGNVGGVGDGVPKRRRRMKITVIHCWSAPRSRSTALMYSFEARRRNNSNNGNGNRKKCCCVVLDEPLYRDWLIRYRSIVHRPYMEEMITGNIDNMMKKNKKNDNDSTDDDDDQDQDQDQEAILLFKEACQYPEKWKREQRTFQQRLIDAANTILLENNNDNDNDHDDNDNDGIIFCKHMAKHSTLFDFHTNDVIQQQTTNMTTTSTTSTTTSTTSTTSTSTSTSTTSAAADNNNNNYELDHKHILLIRDPVCVLSSWNESNSNHNSTISSNEIGYVQLLSIYSQIISLSSCSTSTNSCTTTSTTNSTSSTTSSNNSCSCYILDSDLLVHDPMSTLTDVCNGLHIDSSKETIQSMLSWHNGIHDCDGPWSIWWYKQVHQSNGWRIKKTASTSTSSTSTTSTSTSYRIFPSQYMETLRISYPAYDFLKRQTKSYIERNVYYYYNNNNKPSPPLPPPPKQQQQPNDIYEDPRNANVFVWIGTPKRFRGGGCGNCLIPRDIANISPFDSSVQGGDATWEGIRIYRGTILALDQHLIRLYKSIRALDFQNIHHRDEIVDAIYTTLAANNMRNDAHIRLTISRGEKYTSSMNPKFNIYGTTLIILPEWKPISGGRTTNNNKLGISLITACQRRNSSQCVDSKIHHNNMINNILPKIQANVASCDDAIMLDVEGYVSETNATNLFMVNEQGVLITPTIDSCLPGITRNTVLQLARDELHIPVEVRRVSLSEFHSATEVFTTGTMGELTPVIQIDGRKIGNIFHVVDDDVDDDDNKNNKNENDDNNYDAAGPITKRIQELYSTLPERHGSWSTPLPPFV